MRFGNTKLSEAALILMHERGGRFKINNVGFFFLPSYVLNVQEAKGFFTFINWFVCERIAMITKNVYYRPQIGAR